VDRLILLFIRHAEKSGENWPGPGLTEKGEQDSKSLVIRGWQRAGAWTALFGAGRGGDDYPAPQKIYAATPGAPDHLNHGPSSRPAETIIPLASRLGLDPDETFAKGDEHKLVQKLLALSGTVLVCWEHKAIVHDILPNIPVSTGVPPTGWHDSRYDVVLRFDRPEGGQKFSFRALYPKLLSGDSKDPL
jgi:hypothetical protein